MMILVIALSGMAHATIVSVQYGAWPYGSAGWPEHYLSLGNGGGYVRAIIRSLMGYTDAGGCANKWLCFNRWWLRKQMGEWRLRAVEP